MNRLRFFFATACLVQAFFMSSSCQVEGTEGSNLCALDSYWSDTYSGKLGIQVREARISGKLEPRMYLADKLLYATGVNCYNLFLQCYDTGSISMDRVRQTVDVLVKEEVPLVRFSCSPYAAASFDLYVKDKSGFLGALDQVAAMCDEAHIAIIPSVFWNTPAVPERFGETNHSWGDVGSRTYAFMLEYTTDIVNTLKRHKCLVAWEFGNEFNLNADIPHAFTITAKEEEVAMKGFASRVQELDEDGRMIASGNSIMRNAQYHLMTEKQWTNDSYAEYKEITSIFTPSPMTGMSEHLYEEDRVFSDLGTISRTDQVANAKKVAAELGKVYYVGEFTGPLTAKNDSLTVRRHYIAYYAQRVQLSLIWNFALRGDIEYSFKSGTKNGDMAFGMMREYNQKFKNISEN